MATRIRLADVLSSASKESALPRQVVDRVADPRLDLDNLTVPSGPGQAAVDGFREADASQRELVDYFGKLIAERRGRPKDDLLSAFIAAGGQRQHPG